MRPDFHDFIILGCDGVFDRLTNQNALDLSWDVVTQLRAGEIKQNSNTLVWLLGTNRMSLVVTGAATPNSSNCCAATRDHEHEHMTNRTCIPTMTHNLLEL